MKITNTPSINLDSTPNTAQEENPAPKPSETPATPSNNPAVYLTLLGGGVVFGEPQQLTTGGSLAIAPTGHVSFGVAVQEKFMPTKWQDHQTQLSAELTLPLFNEVGLNAGGYSQWGPNHNLTGGALLGLRYQAERVDGLTLGFGFNGYAKLAEQNSENSQLEFLQTPFINRISGVVTLRVGFVGRDG